jgi:pre-rRNA-processing protein TSR4
MPSNPSALGNQIFGASTTSTVAPSPSPSAEEPVSDDTDVDDDSNTSQQSLTVALAATTLNDSPWKAASAYNPLYLSTTSEYLPPVAQPKLPAGVQVIHPDNDSKNDPIWSEAYENSLKIDNVFERFVKRVSHESEQCLRLASSTRLNPSNT